MQNLEKTQIEQQILENKLQLQAVAVGLEQQRGDEREKMRKEKAEQFQR